MRIKTGLGSGGREEEKRKTPVLMMVLFILPLLPKNVH
jgi:hypothetical protein